jgi:hypothetical protein
VHDERSEHQYSHLNPIPPPLASAVVQSSASLVLWRDFSSCFQNLQAQDTRTYGLVRAISYWNGPTLPTSKSVQIPVALTCSEEGNVNLAHHPGEHNEEERKIN